MVDSRYEAGGGKAGRWEKGCDIFRKETDTNISKQMPCFLSCHLERKCMPLLAPWALMDHVVLTGLAFFENSKSVKERSYKCCSTLCTQHQD